MQLKHWILFILLGLIWSTSFLWIKIAVTQISPWVLVALRALLGALTGVVIILLRRAKWPRGGSTWGVFLLLGLTSVVIPFLLIAWGEQRIDSAMASILNASVPLFTILLAHFFTRDDRINLPRVLGLLIGFGGVVLLLSPDLNGEFDPDSLTGQAAVLLAAVFYAVSTVFARRTTAHVDGLVRGAAPLMTASIFLWAATPWVEWPIRLPASLPGWTAVLWLGILGSGVALIIWYYLLHEIGPTRTTLVSYIFPLGGVLLGIFFLGEAFTWQLAAGSALIIASLVVVNWRRPKSRAKSP